MNVLSHLSTVDELLICIIRATKNAKGMPVINENNLVATCDYIVDLVEQARYELKEARDKIVESL